MPHVLSASCKTKTLIIPSKASVHQITKTANSPLHIFLRTSVMGVNLQQSMSIGRIKRNAETKNPSFMPQPKKHQAIIVYATRTIGWATRLGTSVAENGCNLRLHLS